MAQVQFKRGTSVPSTREEGALYLKEDSVNEKFDLYFGGSNKILKLNAETANKAACLQSPGSSTSLGYLDWTGSQENCIWFATWDDQTYPSKPTVRAMNDSNMRKNLSVYSKAEGDSRYGRLNSLNSGFLSTNEFLSAPTIGNGSNYIAFPDGGQYKGGISDTGFLEIALPETAHRSNTMVKFKVSIFNYYTHTSVDYIISGYTYQDSPYWYQMTALCLGKKGTTHSNHTVRFGYDNSRMYVYIGESDTKWSYPNITISDITIGHSGTFDKWKNGWRVSIVSSTSANLHGSVFQNTSLVYETYQADQAKKLTSNAGSAINPVYFSDGIPVACNRGFWNSLPAIGGDGVMEIGKYIDFHKNKEDSSDYCYRFTANDDGTLTGSGPINASLNGNALTATNADKLDGYHHTSFTGRTATTIDVSVLDINTYYPVTIKLPYEGLLRIKLAVQLNSGTKPSWSTHSGGFTSNIDVGIIASGWGTAKERHIVYQDEYGFANKKPAYFGGQLRNSSNAIFYVLGGGKYHFYTDWKDASIVLYTSSTTLFEQTISPVTNTTTWHSGDYTSLGTNILGNAATATKLFTARSVKTDLGSTSAASFDGSEDISPGVTGTLPIANGGTGATAAKDARYNLLFVSSPITSTTNDTIENWGKLGPATISFYATTGQLIDQPSQYGLLLNLNNKGTEVHQLWLTQASGNIAHRGGNASGWSGTWRVLLDSSNYTTYASNKDHTHWYLVPNGGGENTIMLNSVGNIYPRHDNTQDIGMYFDDTADPDKRRKYFKTVNCYSVNNVSDRRLKDNINTNLDSYVNMLDLITPTSYMLKPDMKKGIYKRNVGYIAQEVQEALHQVGLKDDDFGALFYNAEIEKKGGETYGLNYSQFIPILHAKIKQLEENYNKKIEELNEKITALTVNKEDF